MTPRLVLLIGSLFAPALAAGGEPRPLSPERRVELRQEFAAGIREATDALKGDPTSIRLYSSRGDAYFFSGEFDQAVADYDRTIELDRDLATSHWRRGIALFYAGRYDEAARQFERYHSFDNVDRENGIWRYLSQFKADGRETARAGLLKYRKDDREPFPAVYQLFAGNVTPEQILQGIESAEITETEREKRRFYAHLYIGLNHAVEDRPDAAARHLAKAVENQWALKAGYGPNYMWHVARLHYEQLAGTQERSDQSSEGRR